MKSFGSYSKPFSVGLLAALALSVPSAFGQGQTQAVVRDVQGTAQLFRSGEWKTAELGQRAGAGAVVRTGPSGSVDLNLGANGPFLRVMPDSDLAVNRLSSRGSVEPIIATELDLRRGRILGVVNRLSDASRYEVIIPQGVVGIRAADGQTEYDINGNGVVHIVTGQAVVVYANPQDPNNPSVVTVNAGETAYPPSRPGEEVVAQTTDENISNELQGLFGSIGSIVTVYATTPNPPAPAGEPTPGAPGRPVQITTTIPEPFVSPTTGGR